MIHPTGEACKDIKGSVKLSFIVNADKRPAKITIQKSLCPSADREAIRLIQEGPDWTPGSKTVKITVQF
jgi:TonB family protein